MPRIATVFLSLCSIWLLCGCGLFDLPGPSTAHATAPDDFEIPGPVGLDRMQECDDPGLWTRPYEEDLDCSANPAGAFYDTDFYLLEDVLPGDCVHVFADNAGSGAADLFVIMLDAGDNFRTLDDSGEECSVDPWAGSYDCPAGGAEAEAAGDFVIAVGKYTDDGCDDGDFADYQLHVAVNGFDLNMGVGPAANDEVWQPE